MEMNKRWKKRSFLVFVFLISGNVMADLVLSGRYETLEGEIQHIFSESGDYWGEIKDIERAVEFSDTGVFEQGKEVCRLENKSQTITGNVLIYVGEVQCCLEVRQISDKFAVTKIWVKGTGFGYRVCKNQVLRKVKD